MVNNAIRAIYAKVAMPSLPIQTINSTDVSNI